MKKQGLYLLFFGGLAAAFLTPMELGDIWWHLSTGRWILEHRGLPQADPFSIAPAGGSFVLTSFWLSQITLFTIYSLFGLHGLIVLKAALFAGTALCVERLLAGSALKAPLRFTVLLPIAFVATYYDEIRPQTFSFFFFALTLYLIEQRASKPGTKAVWLLPPLMLIWSNMHGGVVMGLALVFAYTLVSIVKTLYLGVTRKPGTKGQGGILQGLLHDPFAPVFVVSAALSYLNPNGYQAVSLAFGMFMGSAKGVVEIHEHLPIAQFAALTGQAPLHAAITAITAVGLFSFLLKIKKLDITLLLVFSALSYASFVSFRVGFFFTILAAAAIGKNLGGTRADRVFPPLKGGPRLAAFAAAALSVAAMVAVFILPRTVFRQALINESLFPVKAADFVLSAGLPGNLYHPYEWGGYLIWRLHPDYKVFIDGRAIGLLKEYTEVLTAGPALHDILDKQGINTVLYWPLLPFKGGAPPVLYSLLKDDGWRPVYWDLQSLVFVRTEYAQNPIKDQTAWELLTSMVSSRLRLGPDDPENHIALAELFVERGMRYDARDALLRALALDPKNTRAALLLSNIKVN